MAKNLNLFLNNPDRATKKWCHMTSEKKNNYRENTGNKAN